MKPYAARPLMRTRFQSPVSFVTQPFTYQWPVTNTRQMATNPATNIVRMEDGFQIQVAVPGVPKNQIQLKVMEDQLIISTTHQNGEGEKRFIRKEFDFTNFKRSFTLPNTADTDNLKASFENGILTITIPDKTPETKKIEIQ